MTYEETKELLDQYSIEDLQYLQKMIDESISAKSTLISITGEETIESAAKDPFRPSMTFADEYGKFNIGDTIVIIKK